MLPDVALSRAPTGSPWQRGLSRLVVCWSVLAVITLSEWREMAHQWWDIDTYNHVLLVPAILGWLVWLQREELATIKPQGWWPGLVFSGLGLLLWLGGRVSEINLVAQSGVVMAMQGAVLTLLGLRVALVLAFPLLYAFFLVPFGDELVPALQQITAHITVALIHASGVPALVNGLDIDTPGGKFVIAEECSGVKFLIAMTALTVLIAWTGFRSWKRRLALIAGAALLSIGANGIRAWGTIYVGQYVGAERAGSFDHLVYGWVFFAVIIGLVLAIAWRFAEREPQEAGLTAEEAKSHSLARLEVHSISSGAALAVFAGLALSFAALSALV